MASLLLINQIESVQRAEYHPETVPKSPTYVPKQTKKNTYRAQRGRRCVHRGRRGRKWRRAWLPESSCGLASSSRNPRRLKHGLQRRPGELAGEPSSAALERERGRCNAQGNGIERRGLGRRRWRARARGRGERSVCGSWRRCHKGKCFF